MVSPGDNTVAVPSSFLHFLSTKSTVTCTGVILSNFSLSSCKDEFYIGLQLVISLGSFTIPIMPIMFT